MSRHAAPLRRLDERFAARGPLALVRDVPQLGLLAIAAIFLIAAATVVTRRTPPRPANAAGPAAQPTGSPTAVTAVAAARVGPIDGTPVSGYLEAARTELARRVARDPAETAYAVVDFAAYRTPAETAAAIAAVPGLALSRALARLSMADQPTDVLDVSVRALPGDLAAAFAAESARRRDEATELRRLAASIEGSSRDETTYKAYYAASAATAQAEADAYGRSCPCVFAVVLSGRLTALSALAGRPEVRVVDPAPVGVPANVLVFAGLLPEQTGTVTPIVGAGPALPVPSATSSR
ncbi:MAG: hypothetical protein NVSMB13_13230 [Mycobacteriales bacterium]